MQGRVAFPFQTHALVGIKFVFSNAVKIVGVVYLMQQLLVLVVVKGCAVMFVSLSV